MKNKKKILVAAVGIILVLVLGITTFAVKKNGGKKVSVYSVVELNGGGGFYQNSQMTGIVTSDANQIIKYDPNEKVEELFVTEGQEVKKGDKLISFDVTSKDIELQMKKLDKEGLGIQIEKLRRDIKELRNTKPVPQKPDVPDIPDEPDMPVKPDNPNEPVKPDMPVEPVQAQKVLDEHSLPYTGKGTSNDPFHYLVSQKGKITGKFLNKLAKEKQLFVIEVRQGDVSTGEIIKFFGQKMSEKDTVEDENAIYNLELTMEKKVEEEKEISAYDVLSKVEVEKEGWLSGNGTADSPYVFLVKDDGIVKGNFFKSMKEKGLYFRIEVREKNQNDGIIVKAWEQNGKFIKDVKDDEEYKVDLKIKQEEIKKEETDKEETNKENPKQEDSIQNDTKEHEKEVEEEIDQKEEKEIQMSKYFNDKYKLINTATVDYVMDTDLGVTASDIKSQIAEIESQIKELQLNEKEAEIEIRKMERKLENQTIVSAVDGIVKTVGDPERPSSDGSPLLAVESSNGLYITGNVPENKLEHMKKGTILEGFSGRSGMSFTAEVTSVSPYPSGDRNMYGDGSNNSMYPFTAYIESPDGLQNDDYVELGFTDDNAIMSEKIELMKPFVKYEDGRYFVMIADEKNKLKKQYVKVVGNSYFVTVEGGITMDDRIAFPYGKNVKEGASVKDATIDELYGGY